MRIRILKVINLILALFLAVFSVSYVFAWFSGQVDVNLNLNGNARAYFAYGDGTSGNPYGITNNIHLYNLSWLQNSGRISVGTYFELGADITVDESLYIAPIGNNAYPFESTFNGNGHTITNLKVTTRKPRLLNSDPASKAEYVFSSAVGFFGMTGSASVIKNFILDNPSVEAEAVPGGGDDTITKYYNDSKVIGLAIGDVNGKARNIGVYGGALSVQETGYLTKNSIVGEIDEGNYTSTSETPPGQIGGDTGYFIPDTILTKAHTNENINTGIFSNITIDSSYNVKEDTTEVYDLSDNTWVISNDNDTTIGSSNGSQNYLGLGCFSYISGSETSLRYQKDNGSAGFTSFNLADATKTIKVQNNSDTKVYYVPENNTTVNVTDTSYITDIDGQTALNQLKYALYFNNSPSQATSLNILNEAKDGYIYSGTPSYTVSHDVIKFYVSDPSKLKVVVVVGANTEQDKDRYLAIAKTSSAIQGNFYFSERYYNLNDSFTGEGLKSHPLQAVEFINVEPIICELDLTGENAGAGVYSVYNITGGVRIYYLAVTGAQGTSGEDNQVEVGIDTIDFIDKNDSTVDMAPNEDDYKFTYDPTGTLIQFLTGSTTSVIIYYDRISATQSGGERIRIQTSDIAGRPTASYVTRALFFNNSGLVYPRTV